MRGGSKFGIKFYILWTCRQGREYKSDGEVFSIVGIPSSGFFLSTKQEPERLLDLTGHGQTRGAEPEA